MARGTASGSLARRRLEDGSLAELHELASALGIPRYRLLRRPELVDAILSAAPPAEEAKAGLELEAAPQAGKPEPAPEPRRREEETAPPEEQERCEGVVEVTPERHAFLRVSGLRRSDADVYVPPRLVRELGLRRGDRIAGSARGARRSERHPTLLEIDTINGHPVHESPLDRRSFEDLTVAPPTVRFPFRHEPGDAAARMVDLLAPFAKGQRCLIAGPRGAGATSLMLAIARAVSGDVTPVVLALAARPEEQATLDAGGDVEVYALSADARPLEQLDLAELALERAKRRVEEGEDAIVLLDSLTALARAYALAGERSGRRGRGRGARAEAETKEAGDGETGETGGARGAREAGASGVAGVDAVPAAMRWLASARATEGGGSLTIVAAVRTGSDSRFEDLLYGSAADLADAELHLDRDLAEGRLWPAIDPLRSRTRWQDSEDAGPDARRPMLRRRLAAEEPARAWRLLAEEIDATASNDELLARLDPARDAWGGAL